MRIYDWLKLRIEEQKDLIKNEPNAPKELTAFREGKIRAFERVLAEVD